MRLNKAKNAVVKNFEAGREKVSAAFNNHDLRDKVTKTVAVLGIGCMLGSKIGKNLTTDRMMVVVKAAADDATYSRIANAVKHK